jgi:hypothetical protein
LLFEIGIEGAPVIRRLSLAGKAALRMCNKLSDDLAQARVVVRGRRMD